MSNPRVIGIVGASARAAAMSAVRAGFTPWAVDLFADRDLKRIATVVRCPFDRYPDALPDLAAAMPPGPVMYTGGLENHPRVVERLAAGRELWGNSPAVLAAVRDPWRLAHTLSGKGFAYPAILPVGEPCPTTGSWLAKSITSAGGLGVQVAKPGEPAPAGCYLQEFVPGPAMSAQFNASNPKCELLGVTEQLVGEPWLHAKPFAYCGNIGPVEIHPAVRNELARLGHHLMSACGVRGFFGVDFILHAGEPLVIEVNPRYTAAVEVVELGTGMAAFSDPLSPFEEERVRVRGCNSGEGYHPTPSPRPSPPRRGRGRKNDLVGKAIYFAPRRIVFPTTGPWDADLAGPFDPWRVPGFADIPEPGEAIEPGHPVLTTFATGPTAHAVRSALQSRAAELDALFAEFTP